MDTTKTINLMEWCAGYCGIGLGLKSVLGERLRTIAYCELEGFAQANIISKMEKGLLDVAPLWSDLKTFPCQEFHGLVDILVAGYPCQPFSAAGKRQGENDPRHLWPYIRNAIGTMEPGMCFLENVEGHISLGLSTVISDLEELGYKVSWGIFSASEVGAPHQRKRVFIMANNTNIGIQGCGSGWFQEPQTYAGQALPVRCGNAGGIWPSRPGEPQHAWEPPRVVGNSLLHGHTSNEITGGTGAGETERRVQEPAGGSGAMGNAPQRQDNGRESRDMGQETGEGRCGDHAADGTGESAGLADDGIQRGDGRADRTGRRVGQSRETGEDVAGIRSEGDGLRQTQPPLGECFDEYSGFLGQALTLNPYGDNVYAYENISKKIRAREVLFSVWREAISKEIQWTAGGLQCFLAEKVLQSGMQLDSFTQRICYFVWCIQTGREAQGWGLHGMWVYETCGNSSQGQKPIEQFKRELGYAMCQLSYEIALEGRKDAVETEGILQGVREASERAWALSQALPEMEEVWRSSLDQAVWEKGCYIEATSIGNRTDELRLLGNGVVPATAARAFVTLLQELTK